MKILNVQQGSKEWHDARIGVVTGTGLKKVMSSTYKKYMYELIAQRFETVEDYTNDEMLRGSMLEDWAIDEYEKMEGTPYTRHRF